MLRFPIMRFRPTDMLKETLRDIAQQTLAQASKICLRDIPCPQLDGNACWARQCQDEI